MIRNASIYLVSSVVSKGTPFLLLSYLTHFLTTQDFNKAALLITAATLLTVLISFGTQSIIPKYYLRKSQWDFSQVLWHVFFIISVVFFILIILLLILAFFGGISKDYFAVLFSAYFLSILNSYLSLLRTKERVVTYFFLEVSYALILAFSVFFLIQINVIAYYSWFYCYVIVNLLFGAYGFYSLFRVIGKQKIMNKALYKELLEICLPLIPHSIALMLISVSDRYILDYFVSDIELGGYILAANVALAIKVVSDALMKSWNVFYVKNYDNKDDLFRYKVGILLFMVLFSIGVYFVYIISFEFLFDANYIKSIDYLPYLLGGLVMFSAYQINVSKLIVGSKTWILKYITPFSALFNIVINILLIPEWGAVIAAISTFLSYTLMTMLVLFFTKYISRNEAQA